MNSFHNFQSYPNTYCNKLKGTPPKITFVTPKNGHLNMPGPHNVEGKWNHLSIAFPIQWVCLKAKCK